MRSHDHNSSLDTDVVAVDEDGDEATVGVVEGELHRHAVGVAPVLPLVVVEQRVHVVALLEHPAGGMQRVDLAQGPAVPHVEVAVEHPVGGDVGAPGRLARDGRWVRVAQRLEVRRGDEAAPGEVVGTDHAARVEVVPLVPAVVRHLVAPVRLHQGEQHGAQLDRLGLGEDLDGLALLGCLFLGHEERT